MEAFWGDLRYALRQLHRSPGFALTAVLTLALGLGATTAMLAIVDSVLVRPVTLPHADRVIALGRTMQGRPENSLRYKDLEALQFNVKSFEALAGYQSLPTPVGTAAGTRVTQLFHVTPGFFAVSAVPARLGRVLSEADKDAPVAIVSDVFWKDTLHGDPHAIGSSIKIEGFLFHIVGVLPPGFTFPQPMEGPAVYLPLVVNANGEDAHGFATLPTLARIRPGVSSASARAEATAVYTHLPVLTDGDRGQLTLQSYRATITGEEQPALLALLGACGMLLLIACANSANLQIARGVSRTAEIQVRAALGATRARLLRQLVTESVTVSLFGAALALGLACAALRFARLAYTQQFARFGELALHPAVFAGCALLAIALGALAALAPAWSTLRYADSALAAQAVRVTRRSRLSSGLVVVEIALTCVLLSGAGLFVRTFRALQQVPLGFDPHHVSGLTLTPVDPHESGPALKQTYDRLLVSLGALPGVEAAATQTSLPFSRFTITLDSTFRIAGLPQRKDQKVALSLISEGYSRTLAVPLREGRDLSSEDRLGTQPVALVNTAFVRRFLSGQRAVGHVVEFTSDAGNGDDDRFLKQPVTVMGVLPDEVSGRSLANQVEPTLFLNYRQFPPEGQSAQFVFGLAPQFAVRSALPQAVLERELRGALKAAAPDMAEMQIYSLDAGIAGSLTTQRLALRLAGGFGLLALLLASVGLYGVLAYSVAQRTREIGIRMALGSTRAGAMGLVLRQAAFLVIAGLLLGLAGAWPTGQAVRSFLCGVTPLDPFTLLAATMLLLLVAACAAAIPAQRATQVDPIEALRAE